MNQKAFTVATYKIYRTYLIRNTSCALVCIYIHIYLTSHTRCVRVRCIWNALCDVYIHSLRRFAWILTRMFTFPRRSFQSSWFEEYVPLYHPYRKSVLRVSYQFVQAVQKLFLSGCTNKSSAKFVSTRTCSTKKARKNLNVLCAENELFPQNDFQRFKFVTHRIGHYPNKCLNINEIRIWIRIC